MPLHPVAPHPSTPKRDGMPATELDGGWARADPRPRGETLEGCDGGTVDHARAPRLGPRWGLVGGCQ